MDSLADALVAGKYRVLRALGRGSLGTVYLCRSASEGQLMTLKLPHPQLMASEVFRTQFWLEIGEAARLHGPNVVPIIEFGDDLELGSYYLAMPYVAHPDLATVLRENGPLPDERSVEIAMQVLEALSAAHAVDLAHLNLKPSNVFVQTASGEGANHTLVADFGCARLAPGGTWPAPRPIPAAMIGTPEYASPEHARGWALDARSDIYAVGVMLYEMLAGRRPFEAASAFDIARMHCGTPPPPPSGFRRTDPELESVCLKALSKTPDARYQSAAEMRAVLAPVHKRLARSKRRAAVSAAPKAQHDSLAPFERAAPEIPMTIPKRRAALAWVAVVGLACAGWAGYGALTQWQPGALKAAVSRRAPAESHAPLRLLIPDEQTAPAVEPPATEPPASGDAEPAHSAEPAQLVAIQAPAEAQPSAATLSDPIPSKARGNVTLGAAWPRAETSEAFRSALDVAAITECYRKALAQPGTPEQRFSARLDLETAIDGRVRWAKLRAPQLAPAARRCIEHAALTARVSDPERDTLEASVLVEFSL